MSSWALREDDGLSRFIVSGGDDGGDLLKSPHVLQRVRDVLQSAFSTNEMRWALDPFSPKDQRYAAIERVLNDAIVADRMRNGPLARMVADADVVQRLYAETIGWGPAQRYLDDPRVTEVKINGTSIIVQEIGKPPALAAERFESPDDATNRVRLLASMLGIQLDAANPQQSLPVSHGTRVHATIPPRSRNGSLICIRRGRSRPWCLRDLQERGMINQSIHDILMSLIAARCSILIVGRTDSGKTALMEALINSALGMPHVEVIEDQVSELHIDDATRNCTYLAADTANDTRDYANVVREALRQTPDIACPSETRGAEAASTIQLALTGHMVVTTMHAKKPSVAITRMASLASMPGSPFYEGRYQDALVDVIEAFPVVVVVRKLESRELYGRRIVETIAATDGMDANGRPRFKLLAEAREENAAVVWRIYADVEDGVLRMRDGSPLTEGLEGSMRFVTSSFMARTAMLTQARVAETREYVRSLMNENRIAAAMAVIDEAWQATRHAPDWSLAVLARQVIDAAPDLFRSYERDADRFGKALFASIAAHDWHRASDFLHRDIMAKVEIVAWITPETGWAEIEQRIRIGIEEQRDIRVRLGDARALFETGYWQRALSLLDPLDVDRIDPELSYEIAYVRLQALRALRQRGQIDESAVLAGEARLQSLEQRRADWLAVIGAEQKG